METGPAASLSNTHVPFSFSAVGVVGHGQWRNGGKKKRKKEKEELPVIYTYPLLNIYTDRELRFEKYFFLERKYIPREIEVN